MLSVKKLLGIENRGANFSETKDHNKKEKTQETAIVPTTESTAELIPEPTTRLVEKSFPQSPIRPLETLALW